MGAETRIKIKKGLDIPVAGPPQQQIEDVVNEIHTVALLGPDTVGLRPGMFVREGDAVRLGQPLFCDKRNADVPYTSPGAGTVVKINRGARRSLQSVVIRLDGDAAETLDSYDAGGLDRLDTASARKMLVASGLWTALRTRPFGHVPAPDAEPAAIFVAAMDSNPLTADPAVIIADAANAFADGLKVIGRLADVPVYVTTAVGAAVSVPDAERFRHVEFEGPHPAGNIGTHIHHLAPVNEHRSVWHLGYQDVIAIGRLFTSGRLPTERVVALGGPMVLRPRLLRSRRGASVVDLLRDEAAPGQLRPVSGSILAGHRATGPLAWLGQYHNQLAVLAEGGEREFLPWARLGLGRFSTTRAFLSHLVHRGPYPLDTAQHGSPRAMIPTGAYERVLPLDMLATPLLKALIVRDTERAVELGCLELEEEDVALCSFVCSSKYEYGPLLRLNLDEVEANG